MLSIPLKSAMISLLSLSHLQHNSHWHWFCCHHHVPIQFCQNHNYTCPCFDCCWCFLINFGNDCNTSALSLTNPMFSSNYITTTITITPNSIVLMLLPSSSCQLAKVQSQIPSKLHQTNNFVIVIAVPQRFTNFAVAPPSKSHHHWHLSFPKPSSLPQLISLQSTLTCQTAWNCTKHN